MQAASSAFFIALLCAVTLTPVVRGYATRRGLLDSSFTSRTIHGQAVPRLGGVAIVAGWTVALTVLFAVEEWVISAASPRLLAGVLVGGLAVAALGVYDDLRGVRARAKFAVQFAVAALAWSAGYRLDHLALPLLGTVELELLGFPLTLLWIAGVTNAVNLVDGVDGLAGSIAVVVLTAMVSLAFAGGDPLLMTLSAALAGAVLGFLVFNAHPASIFMGDGGSTFIGFILAVVSIEASRTESGDVAVLVPVIALGYPIMDTFLAIARRTARGVPMFSADRAHIHHRLLARGFSQPQTVYILAVVTMCLGATAITLFRAPARVTVGALALLAVAALGALRWLGFLDLKKIRAVFKARHRNVERRHRASELATHLRDAADPVALGASLAALGPAFELDHISLEVKGQSWTFTPSGERNLHVVRYGLEPARKDEEVLEVGWSSESSESDRDTEIAIERLCPYIHAAVRRVGRPVAPEKPALPPTPSLDSVF